MQTQNVQIPRLLIFPNFWYKIKGSHFGQNVVHKTPKKHILEQIIMSAKMHFHSNTCLPAFWLIVLLFSLSFQSKILILSSEEQRLLEMEGVSLPTDLPLTKVK